MTANQVDQALAATDAEVGALLLAAREDQWFERKSVRLAPKDLSHPLVAMANAEGGTIAIGLGAGLVEGFSSNAGKLNDFRQAALDFTSPPVRAVFQDRRCVNSVGKDDHILLVRVEPGERVHETHTGECYLRVGDESRKLTYHQRQELEFDKGQSQYDGFPVHGISVADLDLSLVDVFCRSTGSKRATRESVLAARSLLTRRNEVTNAGYLLFGDHPQDIFPQAYVRVLRFLDNTRGTGARLGLEEGKDIRVEGPIPTAIHFAAQAIEELIPSRRALNQQGTFEGQPIVPRDAWLEGLVNAVIHRSYSLAGDHIRVEIYPNRVEIESPGRFPGLANPAHPLQISRFARNPRIARVCADLRIGQELGEGIKRIFEEMRRVGLTDPVYKQNGGSVRLVLQAIPRLDARTASRLPRRSQQVLDVMRSADKPLGTGELIEVLDLSRPTILSVLRALDAEGLVSRSGKSLNDPRSVWLLNDL